MAKFSRPVRYGVRVSPSGAIPPNTDTTIAALSARAAPIARGSAAERLGGAGVFATLGGGSLGLSNAQGADLGTEGGVWMGAKAAGELLRVASAGAMSDADVNQIVSLAQTSAGIVASAPGSTGEGGAGIGASNQGLTNLGRALSVPLGTILGGSLPLAVQALEGPLVNASKEFTLGIERAAPGVAREFGEALAPAGQSVARELGVGANAAAQSISTAVLAAAILVSVAILMSVATGVALGVAIARRRKPAVAA